MITFEVLGAIGVITLDRLAALNAITKEMILQMYEHLLSWQENKAIHALVLRSKSNEVFCAGGDVRSVYMMRDEPLANKLVFFETEYKLDYLLNQYSKPIISLMNGITMGGGVGIGMHVAFPIAGENMVFAMPETAIGLFPDVGGSAILNRLPRAWQNYLGVFGQRLNLAELLYFNLVYAYVPSKHWDVLMADLIESSWQDNPFKEVERVISRYQVLGNPTIQDPLPCFNRFATENFDLMMHNIHSSKEEEWYAFNNRIAKLSPLSMLTTFIQLQKAKTFKLKDALTQDFMLLQHFLEMPEFYEGVRALLIDKDKNPHWTYKHSNDIPQGLLDKLFDKTQVKQLSLNTL